MASGLRTDFRGAIQPSRADHAAREHVHLEPGTYPAGQVLARKASNGRYAEYDPAGSDGLDVARAILPQATTAVLDGSTLVHYRGENGVADEGTRSLSVAVFVTGFFYTSDLTGLDADAVADLGKIVTGSVSNLTAQGTELQIT